MVPRVPEIYYQPRGQSNRHMRKNTVRNPSKIPHGDWGHQLTGGEMEGRIIILFQNMGVMGNTSYKSSQHELDTLRKTMMNKGI